MRALVERVDPASTTSSCIVVPTAGSSCTTVAVASGACILEQSASSSCIISGSADSSCVVEQTASSTCLVESLTTTLCTVTPDAGVSCITPQAAATSCLVPLTPSASSCLVVPDKASFACQPGEKTNWIPWLPGQELDYLVIRPLYTVTQGGTELRSNLGVILRVLKTPTSPAYVFPTNEASAGGGVTAMVRLTASGSTLTYNTTGGILALNTNLETSFPDFLHAYDTDSNTGPSEKICLDVKRLRTLGFDLVDMNFSMFYINSNFFASAVPIQVSFYSGGFPRIISTGGTNRDWDFPGATLIFQETLYTRLVDRVTSFATRDLMMTFQLNLQQRYLHFQPIA